MKQKITLLLLLTFSSGLIFGQTLVDDFESGSGGLVANAGGITTAVVANPNPSGINTTANCLEVKRTATQWWVIAGVNVTPDLAISDTETKYVSMMVYYPAQPDLGIRFDAPDDGSNGGPAVRALNVYTTPNEWQEIVFEIKDEQTATAFTHGTLFRLSIHPDIGFENDPIGQVLDDAGSISGYIDEIQILNSNPLLSNKDFELEKSISLYPNPAQSAFKITTRNNVEYDISSLASGMYIVKMIDNNGGTASKKLIKN